eukprot:s1257_g11.t1
MRKYLRFLRGVLRWFQSFPAGFAHAYYAHDGLVAVSDASWGSPSVSGGAVFWRECLIKAYSRVQKSTTLSSCESETVALCGLIQEVMGARHITECLQRFDQQNLRDLVDMLPSSHEDFDRIGGDDRYHPVIVMSDSTSALALLKNEGLSRRVRHMTLAVSYIQQLVQSGHVELRWIGTNECCADLLTKIFGRELFSLHAKALGYIEVEGPVAFQLDVSKKSKSKSSKEPNTQSENIHEFHFLGDCEPLQLSGFELSGVNKDAIFALKRLLHECRSNSVDAVIFDVCTSGRAGFAQLAKRLPKVRVVSITADTPVQLLGKWIAKEAVILQTLKPCMTWFSPPCTGGSPVLGLIPQQRRFEIQEMHWNNFLEILQAAEPIVKAAGVRVLELSKLCKYWREDVVTSFMSRHGLTFVFDVSRWLKGPEQLCHSDDDLDCNLHTQRWLEEYVPTEEEIRAGMDSPREPASEPAVTEHGDESASQQLLDVPTPRTPALEESQRIAQYYRDHPVPAEESPVRSVRRKTSSSPESWGLVSSRSHSPIPEIPEVIEAQPFVPENDRVQRGSQAGKGATLLLPVSTARTLGVPVKPEELCSSKVYVFPTGRCAHFSHCRFLKQKRVPWSMDLCTQCNSEILSMTEPLYLDAKTCLHSKKNCENYYRDFLRALSWCTDCFQATAPARNDDAVAARAEAHGSASGSSGVQNQPR